MRDMLVAMKGARLIAKGVEEGREILHYLLPDGRVLELIRAAEKKG